MMKNITNFYKNYPERRKENPLNTLFIEQLLIHFENISRFKLHKYSFIGQIYLGSIIQINPYMHKFGPASISVFKTANELHIRNLIKINDRGKIVEVNKSRLLSDINKFKTKTPKIVDIFEDVIIFIKKIEEKVNGFSNLELFTTILFYVYEEGRISISQLFRAVDYEKKQRFSNDDFQWKLKLLKNFCLIKIEGDTVSLADHPYENLKKKLEKSSNQLKKFFERNSRKLANADNQFLMNNCEEFRKYYKKSKKEFSELVGNGLQR